MNFENAQKFHGKFAGQLRVFPLFLYDYGIERQADIVFSILTEAEYTNVCICEMERGWGLTI